MRLTFIESLKLYPLAYSFLLPLQYLTLTRTKTYITPILPYITPHLSLSYQDSDTSCRFSCQFKSTSPIRKTFIIVSRVQIVIYVPKLCFKNAGSYILATVADSDCSCRLSCRFKNKSPNRQPIRKGSYY